MVPAALIGDEGGGDLPHPAAAPRETGSMWITSRPFRFGIALEGGGREAPAKDLRDALAACHDRRELSRPEPPK